MKRSNENKSLTDVLQSAISTFLRVVTQWLQRRSELRSPWLQRGLLALAVAIFAGAAVFGLRSLPSISTGIRWQFFALAGLLGVPLTIATNTGEYLWMASISGSRVRLLDALRVSILASAANLLPIPGAVMVRAQALKNLGSSYRRAFSSTAIVGIAWIATTLSIAGLLQGSRSLGLSVALVGGGIVGLTASAFATRAMTDAGPSQRFAILVAIESGAVLAGGLRLFLVLKGLGIETSFAAAVALTIGITIASAVGFLPGGLGLRELVAGAVAPVVGLAAAAGLLATAVDRVVGLIVNALMAGAVLLPKSGRGQMLPVREDSR